ncbi:MAG: hypothetical protein AAF960_29470 [Bacteroidota bacterium]
MIKRFSLFLVFISTLLAVNARTIYVSASGTGNGTSWTLATNDLQMALNQARKGDEIWVSKGVYFPTKDNNREISFHIKDGVALYGSFVGFEQSIEDRIIKANYSVLSGEIGTKQKTDNTINVLYTAHVTKTTIIDGFIITGGYAGGDSTSAGRRASGGGWYNDGANKGNVSNPTIRNCRFVENTARDGAAMYNNASNGGSCQVTLENCTFQNNKAYLGGGALFNDGEKAGDCTLQIMDSKFLGNKAGFGGAIFNDGKDGKSVCLVRISVFKANQAMMEGGGIFNLSNGGVSQSKLMNCQFIANNAPKGSTVADSQPVRKRTTRTKKI